MKTEPKVEHYQPHHKQEDYGKYNQPQRGANNNTMRHYYIEDLSVNPMREDRIKPVPSIQFNESVNADEVIITIDTGSGKPNSIVGVKIKRSDLTDAHKEVSTWNS